MRRSLKRFSPANLLLGSPGICIYIYIFETKINGEVTFTNFRNLWERIRGIEFIARLLRYNVDETKDILEVVRASWHRVRVCDDSSRFRDNGHARAGFSYAN